MIEKKFMIKMYDGGYVIETYDNKTAEYCTFIKTTFDEINFELRQFFKEEIKSEKNH